MGTTTTAGDPRTSTVSDCAFEAMSSLLAQNWWLIALRGVIGIIFGIIAFVFPRTTMLSMIHSLSWK